MRLARSAAVAAVAFGVGAGQAATFTLTFNGLSNTDGSNVDTGTTQLTVNLFTSPPSHLDSWWGGSSPLPDGNFIDIEILNTGEAASAVTGFYVDDDDLLEYFSFFGNSIINGEGTDFTSPATPDELPGGEEVGFFSEFSAGATEPRLDNGIEPGEVVTLRLQLLGLTALEDVISRIENEQFRIGLLVEGFDGGGVETFTNDPEVIPTPGAAAVLGLSGLLAWRRRR